MGVRQRWEEALGGPGTCLRGHTVATTKRDLALAFSRPRGLSACESSGFGGWESGTSRGPRADGSPFADHRASQAALLSPREPGAHCRPSSIREAGTQAACRTWSGPLKGLSRAGLRLPKQAPHQSRFLKFFYGPFQGLCVDSVDVACRQAPPPTLEGHFASDLHPSEKNLDGGLVFRPQRALGS